MPSVELADTIIIIMTTASMTANFLTNDDQSRLSAAFNAPQQVLSGWSCA